MIVHSSTNMSNDHTIQRIMTRNEAGRPEMKEKPLASFDDYIQYTDTQPKVDTYRSSSLSQAGRQFKIHRGDQ